MNGVVSLLTDFGPGSVYVGQVHAVLRSNAPHVQIVDLAHDVPPGGIQAAAYLLAGSRRYLPAGTVHLVVVDPGVGTERAILAARAHGHLFVGPDNGVLADVVAGGTIRRLEPVPPSPSGGRVAPTFHGRDLMAPLAARLAAGATRLEEVGPPARPAPLGGGARVEGGTVIGAVLLEDRFGNLVTDIPRRLLADVLPPDGRARVHVGETSVAGLSTTFADVDPGCLLAYIGSGDHLEIGVNRGRASLVLGVGVGARVRVEPGA